MNRVTRGTEIRSVLFDMDGVLYAYDYENRLKLLESALEVGAETIRDKVFNSGIERAADTGALDTEAYIAAIAETLGVDVTLRQWLAARKWAMAPAPAVIDLARDLSAKVEIAMLTNNGKMMAEHIAELAPELPSLFGDNLFTSATSGFDKETVEGFTDLLSQLGWDPASTLFVDDNAGYVANAMTAGLVTHVFQDADGLCAVLADCGLLD
jgi:FMN phosphatase YigB (HAD superfamily)